RLQRDLPEQEGPDAAQARHAQEGQGRAVRLEHVSRQQQPARERHADRAELHLRTEEVAGAAAQGGGVFTKVPSPLPCQVAVISWWVAGSPIVRKSYFVATSRRPSPFASSAVSEERLPIDPTPKSDLVSAMRNTGVPCSPTIVAHSTLPPALPFWPAMTR